MPDRPSRRPQFPTDCLAPTGFRSLLARDLGNVALIRGIPVLLRLPWIGEREPRKHVSGSFFGINVAPGLTPEHDEFTLAKVRELGITHVRLDFPERENAPHRRFLRRLNSQGFPVLLHLVQYPRSASEMGQEKVQHQWVDFVQDLIRQEPDLSEIELGSAANRYRFSGYTLRSLMLAIERASPILEAAGIPWNAPGLSDFEPLFLAAALSLLKQRGLLPSAVSCNLHVDRAGGPEVSDPHVAGKTLGRFLGYDLTSKMDSLSRIARDYRVGRIYCSFFFWTLLQEGVAHRRYVTEEQQANYVCRYSVMAAAAGSFDRVFLGPLVSHSRGLIDGAPWHRSFPPAVVLSPTLEGASSSYRERPAYLVSKWLARILPGEQIVGRLPTPPRTHAFAFKSVDDRLWVSLWTQDGAQIVLKPKSIQDSAGRLLAYDRSGRTLTAIPEVISESPIFLRLEALKSALNTNHWFEVAQPGTAASRSVWSDPIEIPAHANRPYGRFENGRYKGVLARSLRGFVPTFGSEQVPGFSNLVPVRETRYCRIFRHSLEGRAEVVQIKEFQPVRFGWTRQSPAFRAWSNLLTARRRNLSVPIPLGFLESCQQPGKHLSYLLTVFQEDATSLRDLNESGENLELTYRLVGTTIRNWHEAGAFHRDLSIGNLLVRKGRSDILVVDLDRARFFRRLGRVRRFRDLARVRVPEGADSEFLTGYFGCTSGLHRWLTLFRRIYRAKLSARRRLRSLIQMDMTGWFG